MKELIVHELLRTEVGTLLRCEVFFEGDVGAIFVLFDIHEYLLSAVATFPLKMTEGPLCRLKQKHMYALRLVVALRYRWISACCYTLRDSLL